MTFAKSLLVKSKLHLYASKYIKEKNEIIFNQKNILRTQSETLCQMQEEVKNMRQFINTITNVAEDLQRRLNNTENFVSYSQTGEDKIIEFLFNDLSMQRPSYLDVGANFPLHISNTYLFYQKGSYGVCVEPDPELYENFKKARPNDVCLNIGIGEKDSDPIPFYVFGDEAKGLNTFSKEEAERVEAGGLYNVKEILNVSLRNINDVIDENFETFPNFLTIDVEGLDYGIIKSLNFEKYPIDVICVETIEYSTHGFRKKIQGTIDFMLSNGYIIYADTHVNTIFVNKRVYPNAK